MFLVLWLSLSLFTACLPWEETLGFTACPMMLYFTTYDHKKIHRKETMIQDSYRFEGKSTGSYYKKIICYWILISESTPEKSLPLKQSFFNLTDGYYPIVDLTAVSLDDGPVTLCFQLKHGWGRDESIEPKDPDFNFIWFSWWTKAREQDTLMILRENVFLD